MDSKRLYQNSDQSNSAQLDRALCRRLLPALKEGAESEPVHITGQATVALTEDNPETGSAAAPPALLV